MALDVPLHAALFQMTAEVRSLESDGWVDDIIERRLSERLSATPFTQAPETNPAPGDAPPASIDVPQTKADDVLIDGRRRPGYNDPLPDRVSQENIGAVRAPPPEAFPTDEFPIPDRWRLIQSLGLVKERWFDPYNQNTYKGDRPINPKKVPWLPIKGEDWFFVVNAVSDTVIEPRTFPIPVGVQTTSRPRSLDVFGKDTSLVASQTFIVGAALIKGMTAFKPPEIEYRVTFALNTSFASRPTMY